VLHEDCKRQEDHNVKISLALNSFEKSLDQGIDTQLEESLVWQLCFKEGQSMDELGYDIHYARAGKV